MDQTLMAQPRPWWLEEELNAFGLDPAVLCAQLFSALPGLSREELLGLVLQDLPGQLSLPWFRDSVDLLLSEDLQITSG